MKLYGQQGILSNNMKWPPDECKIVFSNLDITMAPSTDQTEHQILTLVADTALKQ